MLQLNEAVALEAADLGCRVADEDLAAALASAEKRLRSLNRALLDEATGIFLAEGTALTALGESTDSRLGLWRSQKDARASHAELGSAFALEVPRPLAMSAVAMRVVHSSQDSFSQPGDNFLALGGVLTIETLALPAAPKTVKNWLVRAAPAAPVVLPYQMANIIQVTYQLPDSMLMPPPPLKVGWWDAQASMQISHLK